MAKKRIIAICAYYPIFATTLMPKPNIYQSKVVGEIVKEQIEKYNG